MGPVTRLAARGRCIARSKGLAMDAQLEFPGLLRGCAVFAEEMTDAAVHQRHPSVRIGAYADMAVAAGERAAGGCGHHAPRRPGQSERAACGEPGHQPRDVHLAHPALSERRRIPGGVERPSGRAGLEPVEPRVGRRAATGGAQQRGDVAVPDEQLARRLH